MHLGVGAFARAHLGVYADDLLRSGRPATIAGVSLRSPTAEERLGPQDGLYTVVEREPDRPDELAGRRLLLLGGHRPGSGGRGHRRPDGPPRDADRDGEGLRAGARAVPVDGGAPPSAPAVIARGLARRDRTAPAPTIASLDNLRGNGRRLRERVLDRSRGPSTRRSPAGSDDTVAFPCSVVDRMVPATTDAGRAAIADALGLDDQADRGSRAPPRPGSPRTWPACRTFADVGVELVGDVEPYERRKLWLLNGPHSTLAYLGLLAGHETIAEAAADPTIAAFVRRLVDDVLEVADLPASLASEAFAADALRRFANPALGHTCAQVGTDGSRKLAERILPVVARRRRAGLPTDRLEVVLAAWLASVAHVPVQGRRLPAVDDPEAASLRRLAADGDLHAVADRALGDVGDPCARRRRRRGPAPHHRAWRVRDRRTLTGFRNAGRPRSGRAGPS